MTLNESEESLPDEWANDCPSKRTKVEILVDTTDDITPTLDYDDADGWMEIPTSEIETWVEQSESADVKRTSKVEFPTEIHGSSVRQAVSFDSPFGGSSTPVMGIARTYHKDDRDDWVLVSHGYYGAVGGTGNPMESKLWIYDYAEVCKSVYVDQTFNDPTVTDVARSIQNEILDNTFIPLDSILFRRGGSDEEFALDVTPDGLQSRSGKTPTSYYGVETGSDIEFGVADAGEALGGTIAGAFGEGVGKFVGSFAGDIVTDLVGGATGIGFKSFSPDRDTLVDLLNWYAARLGGIWHFEPAGDGAALVFDVPPVRRRFVQDSVIDETLQEEGITPPADSYHEGVRVERNDALFETKPINTLRLRGRSPKSLLKGNFSGSGVANVLSTSKEFPIVTVRAEPLYEAAAETELGPSNVESSATTVDEATNDAISELRSRLAESAEGDIRLLGVPYINPYDRLDAYETCDDTVESTGSPVTYEVVGVKHADAHDDFYHTIIDVKPYIDESDIEVVESRMN